MRHERRILPSLAVVLAGIAASAAYAAPERTDEATIRAGRNIAVTACISCHVVSPNQAVSPVLGHAIPSFEEIANRPDTTAESLREAMKVARWHTPELAATLLPMSRISDVERAQVVAFILSLREHRD